MRPLSLFDYKVLRAAVTIAAYTLLEKDDDAEFLDEMVSFLRGHCGRCAKKLPKVEDEYVGVCPSCDALQSWVLN